MRPQPSSDAAALPWRCWDTNCTLAFETEDEVKTHHINAHRKSRLPPCHAGCGADYPETYTTIADYDRHLANNHPGFRIQCQFPECGKGYEEYRRYLVHEAIHNRKKDGEGIELESKWECNKCGTMHKTHAERLRCLSKHYRVNTGRKTKKGGWNQDY